VARTRSLSLAPSVAVLMMTGDDAMVCVVTEGCSGDLSHVCLSKEFVTVYYLCVDVYVCLYI